MVYRHILLTFNDEYTKHACVLLASLFESNKGLNGSFFIHVRCFKSQISSESQNTLSRFCSSYNNRIEFKELEINDIEFPNLEQVYLTRESYLRLFSFDNMPNDVDTILYLDVDILIVGDISELFSLKFGNEVLAAVDDLPQPTEVYRRLSIPVEYTYFNSGVMVVDVSKWRKEGLIRKVTEYIRENHHTIIAHDQDVLNALLYNRRKVLDQKYNLLTPYFEGYNKTGSGLEKVNTAKRNPRIIHFAGPIKPWDTWMNHPYWQLYWNHLKHTPYKNYRISIRKEWNLRPWPFNLMNLLHVNRSEMLRKIAIYTSEATLLVKRKIKKLHSDVLWKHKELNQQNW